MLDCVRLEPHAAVHSGYGVDPARHSLHGLTPECVAECLSLPCLDTPGTVQQRLTQWQASAMVNSCLRPNTCAPLPDPLGQLVVSGWFKSLTFHVSLRIASECHLAKVWKELRVATAAECAVAVTEQPGAISAFNSKRNQFSSQMFLSLANDIQLWSAHIVASGLADAEHINNYMHWLSDCCSHLSVD